MTEQLFTEPEKTQQIARREPRLDSTQSFQGRPHPILQLQRILGNQRVGQLIQARRLTPEGKIITLQPKLTVGAADDQYEQEADHVARQVMSMPDAARSNTTQRAISPEEDRDETLQTQPLAGSVTPFVQRQTEGNEEPEEKQMAVQAKFVPETSSGSVQRQSVAEEEESAVSGSNASIQRKCSACDEGKEKQ